MRTIKTVALILLIPSVSMAQPAPSDIQAARALAVDQGVVAVRVTAKTDANGAPTIANTERARQRILTLLVSRGWVVGNEIDMEQDGSFTMKVLLPALDELATDNRILSLKPITERNAP